MFARSLVLLHTQNLGLRIYLNIQEQNSYTLENLLKDFFPKGQEQPLERKDN